MTRHIHVHLPAMDRASRRFRAVDNWVKDPKTGKDLNFSEPFRNRQDALDFAKKNGLGPSNVKSRPAGYIVER